MTGIEALTVLEKTIDAQTYLLNEGGRMQATMNTSMTRDLQLKLEGWNECVIWIKTRMSKIAKKERKVQTTREQNQQLNDFLDSFIKNLQDKGGDENENDS